MTSFDAKHRGGPRPPNSDFRRGCQGGFTYLWTLMTVAMIGLGLTIAADVYSLGIRREREQELLFVGHQFRAALRSYYHAHMRAGQKEYPASLDELIRDTRFPGIRRHLRRIHNDPLRGNGEWGVVRVAGRIVGVHSLSEERPLKQDNFEFEDAAFRHREKYSEWVFTYPANALLGPESIPENAADENGVPDSRAGERNDESRS